MQPEDKIRNAEKAIQALKRHIDKGTCPASLKYTARANIVADKDFKEDVKRIRKYSESEYVKALTRFHYRDIDRHRAELHRNKRPRVQNKASTGRKVKSYSKKGAPSAPELSNVNAKNITKTAEDMQEKIAQFNAMMLKLQEMTNKPVEKYKCLFSESNDNQRAIKKQNLSNKKRKESKRNKRTKQFNARLEANKKHIKNLSNNNMTTEQINLLGRGLKFIPTPLTKQTQIRRQLLQDFDQFTRRMRLQYIFQGEDNEPHPFHIKSTWVPPIQPSVALESYLEKVKL